MSLTQTFVQSLSAGVLLTLWLVPPGQADYQPPSEPSAPSSGTPQQEREEDVQATQKAA